MTSKEGGLFISIKFLAQKISEGTLKKKFSGARGSRRGLHSLTFPETCRENLSKTTNIYPKTKYNDHAYGICLIMRARKKKTLQNTFVCFNLDAGGLRRHRSGPKRRPPINRKIRQSQQKGSETCDCRQGGEQLQSPASPGPPALKRHQLAN